jgi:hypothetical protein
VEKRETRDEVNDGVEMERGGQLTDSRTDTRLTRRDALSIVKRVSVSW